MKDIVRMHGARLMAVTCREFAVVYRRAIGHVCTPFFSGPPDTPSLTLPEQNVDLESRQLSAFWNVPYSHADHSITHYDVTVTNTHRAESYNTSIAHSATSGIGAMNITLTFPNGTSSCDVLTISVTAINDVGASKAAQVNVSIPEGILKYISFVYFRDFHVSLINSSR